MYQNVPTFDPGFSQPRIYPKVMGKQDHLVNVQ